MRGAMQGTVGIRMASYGREAVLLGNDPRRACPSSNVSPLSHLLAPQKSVKRFSVIVRCTRFQQRSDARIRLGGGENRLLLNERISSSDEKVTSSDALRAARGSATTEESAAATWA